MILFSGLNKRHILFFSRTQNKKLNFSNNKIRYLYFGCIKNKKPHGIGIQFCHDKSISSGNFKNGKLDGFGKKIFGPGHVFIGKFFNGQMDEKGYFYDQNSSKWYIFNQGNFKNF